jgi:CRISPR-associated protein (TIGR03986 family)
MADERLIARAVEILRRGRFTARHSSEDAAAFLEGFPPYDEMEAEEINEIAPAALARLGAGARPPRRPASSPAADRRQPPPNLLPSAPFRFVVLPDEVAPGTPTRLDEPIEAGCCATIAIEWAAETPLLIGAADPDEDAVVPLRLGSSGADYVIPGATLRGMIRAAVEIVAHGRLGSANLHHRYGLRDFDHPAYAERSPVSRVGEVKAGWLEQSADGQWQITRCAWAHVPIEALLGSRYGRWQGEQPEQWVQCSLTYKYAAVGMERGNTIDFRKTFGFSAPYDENGRRLVTPAGGQQATLVFSGRLPPGGRKRFEYAFFAPVGAPVPVEPEIAAMFERLYSRPSKNRPVPDGSWRDLKPTLESGGRLPVFFVGDLDRQDDRFFFGLTRLFKVPHERSVGEVLALQANHVAPAVAGGDDAVGYDADFVENLFGYVVEPQRSDMPETASRLPPQAVAKKGRIAFSFAHLAPGQSVRLSEPLATIMMAPRASFAPFYLKSGAEKDYSAETPPRLAGRKRYVPRRADGDRMVGALDQIREMGHAQLERVRQSSRSGRVSGDVQTRLRFLLPETEEELLFRSEIRLHNVSAAELGAVLFALTHGGAPEKPYRHMVGRAKPFGAGQLRVVTVRVAVEPNDNKAKEEIKRPEDDEVATPDGRRGFCPQPADGESPAMNASHRPFLDAFVRQMQKVPGLGQFPEVPAVQEFLGACDPAEAARLAPTLDYLPLPAFNEIRRAVKPLRQQHRSLPPGPAVFPGERDGRLLASPVDRRRFWQRGPGKK